MKRMLSVLYETRHMTEEEIRVKEDKCGELIDKQDEIQQKMFEQMSEETQALFRKYVHLEGLIHAALGKIDYAQGFRDGLRMGVWATKETE